MTHLTLSMENLIVLGVILIMSMVVSFSFGVERGKKTVLASKTGQRVVVTAEEMTPLSTDRAQTRGEDGKGVMASQPQDDTHSSMSGTVSDVPAQGRPAGMNPGRAKEDKQEETDSKVFTVQVASFKKEKYAQKEAMDLKNTGVDTFVIPKGKYSIVCVGKFARKDEARLFSRTLRKKYKDCLIRSL